MKRLTLLCALVALVLPAAAKAETVTVTTTEDGNDSECEVDCTLREALATSTDVATIVVPGGVYDLVSGSLVLSGGRTIQGAGATATLISGPSLRVFMVPSGSPVVTGVRIGDGNAAGAGAGVHVASGAGFTLRDSLVDHNTSATVGGGIYSEGTLTVERSLIQSNDAEDSPAAHGGGVSVNGGTATFTNTTFSTNGADGSGGALHVNGGGAVTLRNVTLAQNAANASPPGQAIYQQSGTIAAINTLVTHTEAGACRLSGTIAWTAGMVHGADTTCGAADANLTVGVDTRASFLGNNGGPTLTYALQLGSPAIDAGNGPCPATDQRGVARPQGGVCDIGAFEAPAPVHQPQPPPSGGSTQPPPQAQQLPDPEAGETVNVVPEGTVRIRLPGRRRFRVLAEGEQLPVGTVVDTLKGRVTLVAAGGQTADFYAGIFRIGQGRGARPLTTLTLVERLSCPRGRNASAAARKKKKRRLWGDGRGRFRTRGKHSAATVVGTKWLVEDRCTSTLTRVVQGRVRVRDFVKRKTVTVRAGRKYVAKARRR
jgi:CSLREA domain-containing protein